MTSIASQVYYAPQHHQRERKLFEGWILAGLSSQLPRPQTMWVADLYTQTILLVRDEKGIVRAFENSCVHRGTQLYTPKRGRNGWKGDALKQVNCGYHGWQYSLKGQVKHIPSPEGIRCATHKLRQYAVFEQAGFIWVSLTEPTLPPEELFSPILSRVQHYHLEEMEPVEAKDFHFAVNWKISLENALDYYHVSTVHPKTVGAHVSLGPTFQDLGWHSLQTLHIAPYGWRGYLDRHCARYRAYSDQELSSLHKYFVYPNLILNVLPYHLTIMQFFPVGPTECVMRYRFCQRRKPGIIEKTRILGTWLASRYILFEDVQMYRKIQQGLQGSSMPEHSLHQQERGIEHFHASLARGLG